MLHGTRTAEHPTARNGDRRGDRIERFVMPSPASPPMDDLAPPEAALRRALLVVPERDGPDHGGDAVVLRKVVAALQARFACDIFTVRGERRALVKAVSMLRHQVPSEWAGYQGVEAREAFAARLSATAYDHVFILYEALFHLAADAPPGGPPVTLYAHNVPSQFAVEDGPLDTFLRTLAQRAERRTFTTPGARLVLISQADRAAAMRTGLAGADVAVAPPGAPPSIPLSEDAAFKPECVITGSYAWWRKRRDLKRFADFVGVRTVHGFDPGVKSVMPSSVLHAGMQEFDWAGAVRLGIVTDRFGGGFKLKTLEYVARNCAIFSSAPIMAEFAAFPHAARFVFDNRDPSQLGAVLHELAARDPAILRAEFTAFKDACCAHYAWETCLAPLVDV
ncbi:MAG: hypothetical protein NW200_02095 [Hyphomonadaceae bacterium]|nr:hypothetical protein [Hyphomonadaceae bacterium]